PALEEGYWRAYRDFYRWSSIGRGAWTKADWRGRLRHLGYAGGWKKFEPLWDWVIRAKRAGALLPALETILTGFGKHSAAKGQIQEAKPEESSDVECLATSP
ncbi:MAG: B12-binding domain-containing radical SAM protein, partial [Blastocatellia bacterium]